jgi:hypothetical protein
MSLRGIFVLVRFLIIAVALIGIAIHEFVVIPNTSTADFVDQLVSAKKRNDASEAENRLLERDRSSFRNDPELIPRIPQLVALLGIRNDRGARHVLTGIGRPTVGPLIAAFDAPLPHVSIGGIPIDDKSLRFNRVISLFEAFKSLHTEAPEVLSRLVTYLDDDDALICDKCVESLAAFGANAVPPLVAILNDPQSNRRPRRYAVIALGRIGRGASAAVPVLRKTLSQANNSDDKRLIQMAIQNAQPRP